MTADREARRAQGRIDAEKRWARYREERKAQGLPPTKEAENRRVTRQIQDPEVEAKWIAIARELGFDESNGFTRLREIARNLFIEEQRLMEHGDRSHTLRPTDQGRLEAYYLQEAEHWRKQAKEDEKVAAMHRKYADKAESYSKQIAASRPEPRA